jgi:aryl-alcohol dehydrogenase-like predicted oxidoreductase
MGFPFSISKITLGTVQLGLKYGIANKMGKPDLESSYEILQTASQNGINSFDTAPNYGDSEKILGQYFDKLSLPVKPVITTKIPKVTLDEGQSAKLVYDNVKTSVLKSSKLLGMDKIPICLLHDPSDMKKYNGAVTKSLIRLKNEDVVNLIGVSVYTPTEVKEFLDLDCFDVIQLPLNLFDTRLIKSGLLQELNKAGKLIFARSIYLQGLFFLNPEELPKNLAVATEYLKTLNDISVESGISMQQLAFTFVRDLKVDSLVIGCETPSQVLKNVELLNSPPLREGVLETILKAFNDLPERIINPTMWGMNKA